ncbi:MAG TPA: hypothetical protein V6C58_12025, partial [Allocoleopsis sp.]
MKYYPLLLFLCLSFTAFTQNDNIFFIENIPEKGFILEKNWKRQFGDDPNWRNPAYDDSNWESFNPVLDINKLKENEKGVAWLRTKLVLSPNIQNTPLTLTINQLAASEIYVNGFLIKKIGEIGPNNTEIIAVSPSLTQIASLPYLTKDSVLTIAVKIAYEENYFRGKIGFNTNYYFKSTLMKTEDTGVVNWHGRKQLYYAWIQFGIFFILTIIHLLFYYNDKKQKANFYFVGTT